MANIFEVAERVSNSIDAMGIDRIDEFGEFAENKFLSGFKVPAQATSLLNQTEQNRFNIDERRQNRTVDLENSRLTSLNDLNDNRFELNTFEDRAKLENLKRRNQINDADNEFKTSSERRKLEEARLSLQLLQNENELESLTHDKQFKSMMDVVNAQGLTGIDKVDFLYKSLEEKGDYSPNLKARVDQEFRKVLAPQLSIVEELEENIAVIAGGATTPAQKSNIKKVAYKTLNLLRKVDSVILQEGIIKGLIDDNDISQDVLEQISSDNISFLNEEEITDTFSTEETEEAEVKPVQEIQPEQPNQPKNSQEVQSEEPTITEKEVDEVVREVFENESINLEINNSLESILKNKNFEYEEYDVYTNDINNLIDNLEQNSSTIENSKMNVVLNRLEERVIYIMEMKELADKIYENLSEDK